MTHAVFKPEDVIDMALGAKRMKNDTYALRKAFYTHEIACM